MVALALEDFCGDEPGTRVGELARHWINATPPANLPRAIRYSHEAADAALRSLAPVDVLRHYTKALELCGRSVTLTRPPARPGHRARDRTTPDRGPVLPGTLLDAAAQAADMGDVDRLVAAVLANDRGFYSAVGSTDAEKVASLEMALDAAPGRPPGPGAGPGHVVLGMAHGSPLERRQALAEEAIAIAESSGDDAVVVRVLNHLHVPLQVPALLELTEARATEGLVRAERIGDPVLLFWAAWWRARGGGPGRGHRRDGPVPRHPRRHGAAIDQPMFAWGHMFVRSLRAQIAGDTDLAEQYATEALKIGTDGGQPDAATIFGAQFNIVSGQRGTQSELAPLIEKMASETPDIPRTFFISILAKAHVEGGRTDRAAELLAEFAAAGFELPLDQLWLTGMVDFAEAAIECRDPAYAGPLLARLEPWAAQLPATGASALGPVSHYLGGLATVLGHFSEADAYFARAAAMSQRMGAKFFAARTDLLWGRMLMRRGAPGDAALARTRLTSARDVALANSYGVVERRAVASLAELG